MPAWSRKDRPARIANGLAFPEPRENFFVHLRAERAGGAAMQLEVVVLDDDR